MCKVVDVFEEQTFKRKSSAHSHRYATEDDKKVLCDLQKLKPFPLIPGRSYGSFVGISAFISDLDEKFEEWLQRHQKNIRLHFLTLHDGESGDEENDIANLLSSLQVDGINNTS